MTTRASIIMWSAGSGVLLGLLMDAVIVGLWTLLGVALPALAPRQVPRWLGALMVVLLAALPVVAGVLGYLEGRLKTQ
jgi:hypothetical protein